MRQEEIKLHGVYTVPALGIVVQITNYPRGSGTKFEALNCKTGRTLTVRAENLGIPCVISESLPEKANPPLLRVLICEFLDRGDASFLEMKRHLQVPSGDILMALSELESRNTIRQFKNSIPRRWYIVVPSRERAGRQAFR